MRWVLATEVQSQGGGWTSLIFPVIFFIAYLVLSSLGRKKKTPIAQKQIQGPSKQMKVVKKQKATLSKKKEICLVKKETPNLKKTGVSVLQKGWNTKRSLRQAFVLAEIFRRPD